MAKYTSEEIRMLGIIARLRGLAYDLATKESSKEVGFYGDPYLALSSPSWGAGLPHPDDLRDVPVVKASKSALTKEFDRGYIAGVKAAKNAMAEKVKEIGRWETPILAHEED